MGNGSNWVTLSVTRMFVIACLKFLNDNKNVYLYYTLLFVWMRSFQILVEVYRKFCWEISVMGSDEVFLLSEQRFSVFKTLVLASHNMYMIAL